MRVAGFAEPGGPIPPPFMPLAHSLHLIVFTLWDADEDAAPETVTYTDGTDARTMYDLLREDPNTRHARLFHNPIPNGGVFDGVRPSPPEPEPEPGHAEETGSSPDAPAIPPGPPIPQSPAPAGPFAAAAPGGSSTPESAPPAPKAPESPELKLS